MNYLSGGLYPPDYLALTNIELLSKILECNIGDLFEIVSDPENPENN